MKSGKLMNDSYKVDHGIVPDPNDENAFDRISRRIPFETKEYVKKMLDRIDEKFEKQQNKNTSDMTNDEFFEFYKGLDYAGKLLYDDEHIVRLIGGSIKKARERK